MSAGSSGNRVVRVLMTALMAFGTPVYAAGPPPPARPSDGQLQQFGKNTCYEKLAKQCVDEGSKAGASLITGMGAAQGAQLNGTATGQQAAAAGSASDFGAAKSKCDDVAMKCEQVCAGDEKARPPKGQKAIDECKKTLGDISGQYQAQSAQSLGDATQTGQVSQASGASPGEAGKPQSSPAGGGGGGGGMGAGMMGAMAGMAAGMMMAQMMNKDQEQQQQQQNMGAIQSDGSVNCSAPDAVNFSACNPYFSQSCTAAIAAGAFSTSAGCQTFAARYCSAPNASAAQIAQAAQSGLPVVGATGEGLSENPAFCQKVLASNFCAQPGRGGCPSCQSLSAQLGSACTTNPTLCLAQSSTTTLETARLTCPTDPMFANPAYAMGGAATVVTGGSGLATSVPVTGGTIVGGAPVVLPQSASASGAATREGVTRSAASTGMSAQSVGAGSGGTQSVRAGGGDRVATAGGGAAVAYNGASAVNTAGPAPDVQGQFGPSLFSTSSQAIRSRCESGRLNCR